MTRPDPYRGTGRTTKQIQVAPRYCNFICPPGALPYARALAHSLNRDDITFFGHHVLADDSWLIASAKFTVVDHAITLDLKKQIRLKVINGRFCPTPAPTPKEN